MKPLAIHLHLPTTGGATLPTMGDSPGIKHSATPTLKGGKGKLVMHLIKIKMPKM